MAETLKRHHIFFIYIVLALVTFISFAYVRHCEFVDYDDGIHVTSNPYVNEGLSAKSVVWAFTTLRTPHLGHWQPMTWISHMLDCELFGLNPFWHHLHNLLLHVANTLLLFWVLKKMTGGIWRSVFVAALFALHPLRVESVAWVTERRDVLSGLFFMLTIASYIWYTERRSVLRYLPVFLFFAIGLMSKSMLVTLPFVLLLLDYWPLERFRRESKGNLGVWSLVLEKLPLFLLVVGSGVIAMIAASECALNSDIGLTYRVSNALISYVAYLYKMIYPANLALMYPLQQYISAWKSILSLLILLILSFLIICIGRRRRHLLVGWLWYLGTLVPVIGLVQIGDQAMADRYTYLPSIGIFIMFTWGTYDVFSRWRYKQVFLGVSSSVLIVALMIGTMMQVRYWKDSFALFKRSAEVTKNNYIMHNNYGSLLIERGQNEEALAHFKEALRITIEYAKVHYNIGIVLCAKNDIAGGIASYKKAIEMDPDYANAHFGLAETLLYQGENDEAVIHFKEVLRIEPERVITYYHLASIYHQNGKLDLVIKYCMEGLRMKPDFVELRINLARTLFKVGKVRECVKHYYKVLEYSPERIEVLDHLSRILATSTDEQIANAEDAVKYAEKACLLSNYKQAYLLDILGISYAAAGRFEEAIAATENAISKAGNRQEFVRELKKRLELYKSGKPYREPIKKDDSIDG